MHSLIGYLCLQQNLITDMQSTCPKATTHWTAMGGTCKWLLERRILLFQYITKDDPTKAPPSWWWVVAADINALSGQVNIIFVKLQAKDLLVSQQAVKFDKLAVLIYAQLEVEGPFTEDYIAAIDKSTHCMFGRWSISNEKIINYLFH